MRLTSPPRGAISALLGAALALTAAVYAPSFGSGYVFDDFPNIVNNGDVHMTALDWESLRRALLASPSEVLVRPLAMLSFAVNWLISGPDPRPMKLTNLAIHLLNGLLLFGLLRSLVRQIKPEATALLAAVVSAAWLLAPINFTAVAYVVQRMESMCHVFVFGGLWAYVAARRRMLGHDQRMTRATAAVVLGTVLGCLTKESAALLPLYALIVEWIAFRFRRSDGKPDRRVYGLHLIVLVLPASMALYWISQHALPAAAWTGRPFTLAQRLLTEPRVVLDYVQWTLLPRPNELALYHDQIAVSQGLFSPIATLISIAVLAAIFIGAIVIRRHWPLVAIGLLWFLSAQLITATVIPLELVFEHRNYFASAGFFLAVFSLLLPDRGGQWIVPRATACIALATLFTAVTLIRALDWGNPVSLALSEAQKNPQSPRTAYELGRAYVLVSKYRADSPLIPNAYAALEHAATLPTADILPDQGLLLLSARLNLPTREETWKRLQHKLATRPLSAQDISGLYSLTQCAIDGACSFPQTEMVQSFLAGLARAPRDTRVLSMYSSYAINVLHDPALALDLSRECVRLAPYDLQMRQNLLLLLATSGRRDEADQLYRRTIADFPSADRNGKLRELLESQTAKAPPSG